MEATDATREEAQELVEVLRPEAKKSLGGLIRRMAEKGDLDHRLWLLRRQRASRPRTGASVPSGGGCSLHAQPVLPCRLCAQELRAEGEHARRVLTELLQEAGPQARPDLVDLLKLEAV